MAESCAAEKGFDDERWKMEGRLRVALLTVCYLEMMEGDDDEKEDDDELASTSVHLKPRV